jgi:hypothetical protein
MEVEGDKGMPGIRIYCAGAVTDATDRFACINPLLPVL